jgi:SRSO17 transposase
MLPGAWLPDLSLSIDESGIPKKGKHSVGVAHQYCGQLGKQANCRVGVYAALVCRGFYCLINALLYLPKEWCERKDAFEMDGILSFALETKSDIIAMATHGHRGLFHLLAGSIAEDVVNHGTCPIWTYSIHKK